MQGATRKPHARRDRESMGVANPLFEGLLRLSIKCWRGNDESIRLRNQMNGMGVEKDGGKGAL